MEFKGTKGKWQLLIDQFENYNIISNGFYLGEARSREDALLISKAPEMLEELIKEVEILKSMGLGDTERCKRKEQLIKQATEL